MLTPLLRTQVLAVVLVMLTGAVGAQSREDWIGKCQSEDAELANSNGYRVCTELYVVELEKQQTALIDQLLARLSRAAEDPPDAAPAIARLGESQQHWRSYVDAHCLVAQALFGPESPVGDAVPSCMADAFEERNRQLGRMLDADREGQDDGPEPVPGR